MDFLESLYSIENFGIYLFVIIGILVILFLIVLFFGKKDQKKRKELEEKLEQTKISNRDAFAEVTPTTSLEAHENSGEEVKPIEPVHVDEEKFKAVSDVAPTTNDVLNSDFTSSVSKEEVSLEEPKKEFDFEALADAISKELADMEKNINVEESEPSLPKVEAPVIKETVEPVHLQAVSPEMPKEVSQVQKPKPVMPSVFSSVYVNREKEEPKVQESKPVTSAKPEIELPKKMDLPKKADSTNEVVKPIIEEKNDDIIFR